MSNNKIPVGWTAFVFGAAFITGIGAGANMTSDAITVKNSEPRVTTPTTTKPVTYQDVLCNSEDEMAVVLTQNGFDHKIGDRFCVHIDALMPRKG